MQLRPQSASAQTQVQPRVTLGVWGQIMPSVVPICASCFEYYQFISIDCCLLQKSQTMLVRHCCSISLFTFGVCKKILTSVCWRPPVSIFLWTAMGYPHGSKTIAWMLTQVGYWSRVLVLKNDSELCHLGAHHPWCEGSMIHVCVAPPYKESIIFPNR